MDYLEVVKAVLYRLNTIRVSGLDDTGAMAWSLAKLLEMRQAMEREQSAEGNDDA